MRLSCIDGQIEYDLEAFSKGYGHPLGGSSTFDASYDPATYICAAIVGTVRAGTAVFELHGEHLVRTRKALWPADNPAPPLPTRGG